MRTRGMTLQAICDKLTAEGVPTPHGGLTFGYTHTDANSYTIVKSDIEVRSPQLAPNCVANHCWSWAWIMMHTVVTGFTPGGWAQIGPFKGWENGGLHANGTNMDECVNYSATQQIANLYEHWITTEAVGVSPLYAVQNGTAGGYDNNKIFYVRGTRYDYCGGGVNYNFPRTGATAAGEIQDAQTQLPGSRSTHEQWLNGVLADGSQGFDWFTGDFRSTSEITRVGWVGHTFPRLTTNIWKHGIRTAHEETLDSTRFSCSCGGCGKRPLLGFCSSLRGTNSHC